MESSCVTGLLLGPNNGSQHVVEANNELLQVTAVAAAIQESCTDFQEVKWWAKSQ